jgi:poly(hydroxyalkanoate) depolymerase family esterase
LPGEWTAAVFREPVTRSLLSRSTHSELYYRLYVPSGRSVCERRPLLVMMHGCSQDAEMFATGTRMNAIAQEQGCMVLYPEQSTAANAMRCWNWFEPDAHQGQGEAGQIARLVQDLVHRGHVDARSIYVAGMSAGAAMAGILALRYPDLFAASALHSGLMFAAADSASAALSVMRAGASASPLATARQLAKELERATLVAPVIVIQGSIDGIVSTRNADQIVAQRLALAGIATEGKPLPVPSNERDYVVGGRKVRQRDYASGATLVVRSLLVNGLGHAWSGGNAQLPYNDAAGPDASRLMLEFLLRHRLPLSATEHRPAATMR